MFPVQGWNVTLTTPTAGLRTSEAAVPHSRPSVFFTLTPWTIRFSKIKKKKDSFESVEVLNCVLRVEMSLLMIWLLNWRGWSSVGRLVTPGCNQLFDVNYWWLTHMNLRLYPFLHMKCFFLFNRPTEMEMNRKWHWLRCSCLGKGVIGFKPLWLCRKGLEHNNRQLPGGFSFNRRDKRHWNVNVPGRAAEDRVDQDRFHRYWIQSQSVAGDFVHTADVSGPHLFFLGLFSPII